MIIKSWPHNMLIRHQLSWSLCTEKTKSKLSKVGSSNQILFLFSLKIYFKKKRRRGGGGGEGPSSPIQPHVPTPMKICPLSFSKLKNPNKIQSTTTYVHLSACLAKNIFHFYPHIILRRNCLDITIFRNSIWSLTLEYFGNSKIWFLLTKSQKQLQFVFMSRHNFSFQILFFFSNFTIIMWT